jgi:DNA-binding winged helix-turn-helix (wHTH) protein/tetratricopeptide (TPR) repeat protein
MERCASGWGFPGRWAARMNTEEMFQFGEFRVDPLDRTLRRNDTPVALNRRAFDVLLYLVRNPGRVISKEELIKHVWPDAFVDDNNLTQSISVLRKALEDRPGAHSCIVTLPGRGYQFIVPVEVIYQPGALTVVSPPADPPPAGAIPAGSVFVQQHTVKTSIVTEEVEELALPAPHRSLVAPVVAFVAVAILGGLGYMGWRRFHPLPTSAKVVIADFQNTTGDATFDRTLDRALAIDLGQSPYMDVMGEREVVATLQYMGLKPDTPLSPDLARQVCERSNRRAFLSGSVASVGKEYLLTLDATDCVTGAKLAGAKAEADSKEQVLSALDSVADKVRSKLGESTKSVENYRVPIVTATTASLDALKAYSIGSSMEAQGRDEFDVMPLYQRAVDLDPNFAMAWSSLATQYYNLSEYKTASQFYRKAFDLSGHVSAKENLIIRARYYAEGQQDLQQGIKVYQLWSDTYPNDWVPWEGLANEYTRLGEYTDAITAGQHALALEPNRPIIYSVLVRAYKRAGRYYEAKLLADEALKRDKGSSALHGLLYVIAWQEQDAAALQRETDWGKDAGWYPEYLQALAAASEGRYKQSVGFFHQAVEEADQDKLDENAAGMASDQAKIELWFGLPAAARATLKQNAKSAEDEADVVMVQAELGDTAPAEAFIAAHGNATQPATLITYLKVPQLRARLAMLRGKPLDAIAALEPTRPYEMASYDVWSERGEAYLQAKEPELAAAQYKTLLDDQSVGFGPRYPLAHLGLARAYAMAGKFADSRTQYEAFLADWKDADADLPVLKDAKAELARLPATNASTP